MPAQTSSQAPGAKPHPASLAKPDPASLGVHTLREAPAAAFRGKRVLVRVDFNVPIEEGRVADDTRIQASLPTLRHLLGLGARVVVVSHLGRPKGTGAEPAFSLKPVADHLEHIGVPCRFFPATVGEGAVAATRALQDGQLLLLENVRFDKAEERNGDAFVALLAQLGDVYVNDAFGTAHRAHASTTGVAKHLPAYAGFLIEAELAALGAALDHPARPFTAILGGAKVSDKITVIERLLEKVDRLVIGGGMAFTFLKAQGHATGKSLLEADKVELAKELLARAQSKGVQVLLPVDVVVADRFAADAQHRTVAANQIPADWMGLDVGPATQALFASAITTSKTVLWNGPMGVFEMPAFEAGTKAVADALAKATAHGATTVVGGGDSAAAAVQFGVAARLTHVSTGGGASLEFLEGKPLPGIVALQQAARA